MVYRGQYQLRIYIPRVCGGVGVHNDVAKYISRV
jgi:hypothetical protein